MNTNLAVNITPHRKFHALVVADLEKEFHFKIGFDKMKAEPVYHNSKGFCFSKELYITGSYSWDEKTLAEELQTELRKHVEFVVIKEVCFIN